MALTAREVMRDAPVIPVIVLQDVAQAAPLARALVAGGIRMLEVTLRTPVALGCIEAIAREVPLAVVGAGTVRSAADAQTAALAGARFAVSPGPVLTQYISDAMKANPEMQGRLAYLRTGRMGTPEEIAEVVLFLATTAPQFLLGQP